MTRLCIVATHSPFSKGWGGIVRSANAYIDAFRRLDLEFTYISCSNSVTSSKRKSHTSNGSVPHNFRLYDANWGAKWGIGPGIIFTLIEMCSADLLFVHGCRTLPTFFAGAVARLFRKRLIIVTHGSMDASRDARIAVKRPIVYAVTERAILWSITCAERLILSGPMEHRTLIAGLSNVPVDYIENFFVFDLNKPLSLAKSRCHYVFIGRLSADKGILGFAKIWSKAASGESRLTLIGTGAGPYYDALVAVAKQDTRMSILGELPQQQVANEIAAASVVVLPTGLDDDVTENFGNVVVEGLIEGRPSIISRGLHWDEYDSSEAIFLFDKTAEGVEQVIRKFEAISQDEYIHICSAAKSLSKHFHISSALQKVSAIISGDPLERS